MTEEQTLFHSISESIQDSEKSQMFGKPCYKVNGKAFVCFFDNEMVFKLQGDMHDDALSSDASQLFDPSRKGRPMKEWVQVPSDYKEQWKRFAIGASEYVGSI